MMKYAERPEYSQGRSETHTGGTLSGAGPLQDHFLSTQRKREIPSVMDTTYQVPGWLRTTLCDSSVFYSFPTCDFGAASTILLDTSLKLHSHSLKSSLYPKGVD